jgi:lysophospholipase L1-like esterase
VPGFLEPSREENAIAPIAAKNWLLKPSLALCGLLLSLTMLELGARTYGWVTSQERTIIADDLLGWKLVPQSKHIYRKEEQAYLIAINSKGLRDAEHSYEKPLGVFRIVIVGDSFVFGSGGVETSDRFTDLLEKSMKNVEVINMGVPAFGSDQEYLYLRAEGLKYHPDLVILCAFENDFRESFSTVNPSNGRPKGYLAASDGQLIFHPPSFSLFYRLAQRSYLFGFTDLALKKVSGAYGRPMNVLEPRERITTFRQIFNQTQALCVQHGAQLLLVYFPFRGQKDSNVIQQVFNELATTQGMRTLDLMGRMGGLDSAYFKKDIHFNAYGHQVVAAALQEYLLANGLLNSAPPSPGSQ